MAEKKMLPVVNLLPFLHGDEAGVMECDVLVQTLHRYGAVLIRDPRVSEEDNELYLDLMERYYAQPYAARIPDQREEIGWQVGVSPPGSEKPLDFGEMILTLPAADRPHIPPREPNEKLRGDPKERFFWRIGPRPVKTAYEELNAPQVVPEAFKDEWAAKMDGWGEKMIKALMTASEMLAFGLCIGRTAFSSMMHSAPHLLAPNGMDLFQWGTPGDIWNAWHRDLNFLTIHGKSRFRGLRIWLRDWTPLVVSVPNGCLLIQVGQQLEWMSGGYFRAGFHEAVCLPETVADIARAKNEGRKLIRVSSTVFGHIASDQILRVLPRFLRDFSPEARNRIVDEYPSIPAGEQVIRALKALGLIQ